MSYNLDWEKQNSWWPIVARKKIYSQHNGELLLSKWFGRLDVFGDGVYQSGGYMKQVFDGMLRMVPKEIQVKRILLLGLGAGSGLRSIFRKFPHAHVVALEYDSTMVELCRTWNVSAVHGDQLEIIQGDLTQTLSTLSGEFDLVLVDVFCGSHVSPVVVLPGVRQSLDRLLAWRGVILVNWFRERESRELCAEFEQTFVVHRYGQINYNTVGLYRRPHMGKAGESPPSGYRDREESLFTIRPLVRASKYKKLLLIDGESCVRWQWGPVVVDHFFCRHEPKRDPLPGTFRLIVWQPYTSATRSHWWSIRDPFNMHFLKGVAELVGPTYDVCWKTQARRHRCAFLAQQEYVIERVSLSDFVRAYHATKVLDFMTRSMFIGVLRYHVRFFPDHVFLTVVRRRGDDRIVAGLATVDYPDLSLSTHVIAFVDPRVPMKSAGVGLINDWYERCFLAGIRFLNFGILRRPGVDPRSWQGYTNFKRQFHLFEVQLPQTVFSLVFPKERKESL